MFVNAERYPYLKEICGHHAAIAEEVFHTARKNTEVASFLGGQGYLDWYSKRWSWDNSINREELGYDLRDGDYSMLALFKGDEQEPFSALCSSFPFLKALLTGVDGLWYAALTRQSPGAGIKRHSHNRQHYVFHLLLNDLDGGQCRMGCGDAVLMLANAGDTALFDYSIPHDSSNYSSSDRVTLMLDFLPGEDQ